MRINFFYYLLLLFGGFNINVNGQWPFYFSDSAVFRLKINETEIGIAKYSMDREGNYERNFTLKMAGQKIDYYMEVSMNNKVWNLIEIINGKDSLIIKNENNIAKYTVKGKSYNYEIDSSTIFYDNYAPVYESIMLKKYDMEKKGKQKFSRYIIPSLKDSVEVEFMGNETRQVNNTELKLLKFNMKLVGIEIQLWCGEDYKIYMENVPIQYATFIREGYEELLKSKTEDPLLSKPEFEDTVYTIMVPMRDGIKLATDIYMPRTSQKKLPTILIRTPYKKETSLLSGHYYAKRGYVVAIQDCRGRFSSEGVWEPFINEAEDGYDAIEWLASQDWSNGKVGMIGGSYVGWVQLWAASLKPPHLTTIIPNVAPPDPFYNIPYEYGTFFIFGSIWWAEVLETNATEDISGVAMKKIFERKYKQILRKLPVIELDKEIFGRENPYWRKWITNNVNGGYWEKANFMAKLKDLDIPVFLQSGWFDGDGIGTKLNYMELKKSKNKNIKLIIGPWGHTDQSTTKLGNLDLGKEAGIDLQTIYLKWFDYWLKDIKNDILKDSLVQIFVIGPNKWFKSNTYPHPKTEFKKLYLESSKGANTSKGDGKLSFIAGNSRKPFDEYIYNPGDPTPTTSSFFKNVEDTTGTRENEINLKDEDKKETEYHKKITDSRTDILVFETEPLKDSLVIAGPLSAVIYASSSAKDTDWFITFSVIDTSGNIFTLTKGTIRARFRLSTYKPILLEKNKIYEYNIDLWQTGIRISKGEKIRIEISSALFPMFSRNLNTGGHNEMETEYIKAYQRIYHSKEFPSHIIIPVINLQ